MTVLDTRITDDAILALERAGLGLGVNAVASLLESTDGRSKHGDRGWLDLSTNQIFVKLSGHLTAWFDEPHLTDRDSGFSPLRHAVARGLMLLARVEAEWPKKVEPQD